MVLCILNRHVFLSHFLVSRLGISKEGAVLRQLGNRFHILTSLKLLLFIRRILNLEVPKVVRIFKNSR